MNLKDQIPLTSLKKLYQPFGVEADVLRLDQVHPIVSGNKWYKLKEYLSEAERLQKKVLLTFGGAYSNHIVATAAAAKAKGFPSIGIIRGEKPITLSDTLQDAADQGMNLFFIDRSSYHLKIIPPEVWRLYKPGEVFIVPEGGYGSLGCQGAATILKEVNSPYSHIAVAVGTGTTVAGLASAASQEQKILGVVALKSYVEMEGAINNLLSDLHAPILLFHDYHFGGYAKKTPQLISFMNDWFRDTGIPSDFVYTGKLFFAVDDLIRKNYFEKGARLLLIHTGGLQGNRSLPKGTLIF